MCVCVASCCDSPDVDARKKAQVLYKSPKDS